MGLFKGVNAAKKRKKKQVNNVTRALRIWLPRWFSPLGSNKPPLYKNYKSYFSIFK